jgi:hypothetical protein
MVIFFFSQLTSETKGKFKHSLRYRNGCSFREFQDTTYPPNPVSDCSWLPAFGCDPGHFQYLCGEAPHSALRLTAADILFLTNLPNIASSF